MKRKSDRDRKHGKFGPENPRVGSTSGCSFSNEFKFKRSPASQDLHDKIRDPLSPCNNEAG